MSYRNITVNDKRYEYVVGRTHTKIKRVGLYKNSDIGVPTNIGSRDTEVVQFVVTPAIVADIISGKIKLPKYKCEGDSKSPPNTLVKEENLKDTEVIKCDICDKILS